MVWEQREKRGFRVYLPWLSFRLNAHEHSDIRMVYTMRRQ